MHRNAKRLAALAAALLFALSGCGRTELTEPGPSPSAPPAPAEQPQESPQTEELERLSLPEGYAPLEAPQTGGLSERDVRRFEYEDLAAPGRPAFDLSALPDRLFADHVHLTPEGYEVLAGMILDALEEMEARAVSQP